MAQTRSTDQTDPNSADREMLAQHTRSRALLRVGLITLLAGVATAVIFHQPAAWGEGEVALSVQRLAWAATLLGGILMYRANGSYGEARGYFRGKIGESFEQKLPALLAEDMKRRSSSGRK